MRIIRRGLILAMPFFPFVIFGPKVNTQPQWKGTISKQDGLVIVKNPREPIYSEPILTLHEELAIGGARAQGPEALSEVRSLAVDGEENIYVLDQRDVKIKVFDKTGRHLRTFGQQGQGPGDLQNPSRIQIDRSRNGLMVINGPLGLSFFDFDGRFIRAISRPDAKPSFNAEIDSQGRLVLDRINVEDMEHRWHILKAFSPDLASSLELRSVFIGSPYNPFDPIVCWTLDRNNRIVFGYPEKYEVEIIAATGETLKRIARDDNPVEVSQEERDRLEHSMRELHLPPEIAEKIRVSKYHSAYSGFLIGDENRLFVRTWKRAGKNYIFDIFDSEGRYLAEIALPPRALRIERNKLYTSEEDDEGFPVVKRYDMTWKF